MRIGIIGAGSMGHAIARRCALAGAVVLLADRSMGRARKIAAEAGRGAPGVVVPATVAAALRTEVVVIAVRFPEALELARSKSPSLDGKAVVDLTIPDRSQQPRCGVLELARAAPQVRWVKAFTTADARVLRKGCGGGVAVDVFVASDDEHAKVAVVELADRSGLRAFDAGGLENAAVLEGMGRLGQEVSERLQLSESWGFKFLPHW
ncbi:NADPH-dependent F420 reductase [Streptomyces sp. NPDC102406]|uniref:NADPH-dependent F420 reductase n=1 Tax=Streptomyces sp. NPDC102406 TaxID=3366171 RepID=UPI00381C2C04